MTKKLIVLLALLIAVNVSAAEVDIWFGGDFDSGVWNNSMNVAPDTWIDIPVYIKGDNKSVYISDMMISLGINKTYIDQFDIDNCFTSSSLSGWDVSLFSNFNDEFETAWASLSFIGFSRISSRNNSWGYWAAPTHILTFRVHSTNAFLNTDEIIVDAIGAGLDPFQGAANVGDTTGAGGYTVNLHFASMFYSPTAIEEEVAIPDEFFINNNYPNPFNPSTKIDYGLPKDTHVAIEIYDILGRKVETLINQEQPAGYYQVVWRAENISSGMYFYRIVADDFTETKKMTLLK